MADILKKNISKFIFLNKDWCILIQISLKFVLKDQISNGTGNGLVSNMRQAIS